MGFFTILFSAIRSFFTFVCRSFTGNKTRQLYYSRDCYQNRRSYTYSAYSREHCEFTPRKLSFCSNVEPTRKTFELLEMEPLEEFSMPSNILAIERNGRTLMNSNETIDGLMSEKVNFRLSQDLYIHAYKTMAFFEEAAETIAIGAYDLTEVTLNEIDGKKGIEFYFCATPGSEELFVAIDDKKLSYFILISKELDRVNGKIIRRESEKIFVKIYKKRFDCGGIYTVIFKVNRMNFQLQHNALRFIEQHRLFSILINNPWYQCQSSQLSQHPSDLAFQSMKNRHELNTEQMQAIECIVNGNYYPLPNLLYGPPGTGKTKTVVAAIETIVRTTNKNILVCAQSNAACDEIAERLAKMLTQTEMLRMYSKSYELDEINSTIKPFCNLIDDELEYPSLPYLYEFRVLICTLSTSGCLVRARNSLDFNPQHFGYVFIDECASAHETMTLVPIAGLCTSVDKLHVNIVLIGDPKQLDAVTKSHWSTELGFKNSWFEQLFNSAMYKRNTMTGKFNQTYITQLVRNYRSHRAILKVPNELFYENMLVAVATPDLISLQMDGLLSNRFPVIFKSVHGYCKKNAKDPSSYNMEEVNAVLMFIEKLLKPQKYEITQSDIGVVSPYKLQCKIIRRLCEKKGFKSITIGSTETFQGQERKVIIISSVRSGGHLGDFLKNPQRFNVMVTRAKSLLIVVGNPHLLSQDKNWATFISFCYKNKSLVQDTKYFRPTKMNR